MQWPVLLAQGAAGRRVWLKKTTLNPQQYMIYQYVELRENYELCWHLVQEAGQVRRRQTGRLGVYAYVRRDRLEDPAFAGWQRLPALQARFPFKNWKREVHNNWRFFGKNRLGMWNFSSQPTIDDAPPAEPQQVWPPLATPTAPAE